MVHRLLDEVPSVPVPAKSLPSSQGQLHHGEVETPTLRVLTPNLHSRTGSVSAAAQCAPTRTCECDSEMFHHYCVCLKCWGSVEILQKDRFNQEVFSGSWSPFCACTCPALVIAAEPGCLAATSEGLRITYREMGGTFCFLC